MSDCTPHDAPAPDDRKIESLDHAQLARRQPAGVVENTWEAIESALRPIVQGEQGAHEVASAFYNVAWIPIHATWQTYTEAMDHVDEGATFTVSWRNAGQLVAELRDRGETYMDWCYDAEQEVVSARVLAAMAALGLRPVV